MPATGQIKPRHIPVLLDEVLAAFTPHANQTYIDATVGDGGHSFALLERIGPSGRLLGLEIAPSQKANTLRFELRKDLAVQQLILTLDERMSFRSNLLEHMIGTEPIGTDRRRAGFDLGLQSRDPDLEKLIEIAADDAQKLEVTSPHVLDPLLRVRRDVNRLALPHLG